jgi:hypothetical protein
MVTRFVAPLAKASARVVGVLDESVRGATHTMFNRIIDRTPHYTGKARANWNVSVGKPDLSTTQSTNESRARAEVAKVLTIPAGSKVYMANGLPYIRHLEYGLYPKNPISDSGRTENGFSTQAPAGMVRISVREFNALIKGGSRASSSK